MKRRLGFAESAVLAVFGLGLLVVGFVAEENWRAKHEWKAYLNAAKARGEQFEIAAFTPAPVPDEQNFATTPLFKPLLTEGEAYSQELTKRLNLPVKTKEAPPSLAHWERYQRIDLNEWRGHLTENLEAAIAAHEPDLEEIRQASKRPYAVFHVDYTSPVGPILTYIPPLQAASKLLYLQAAIFLSNNKTDQAFEDCQALTRLAKIESRDPHLSSLYLSRNTVHLSIQILWEGTLDHRWSEQQLAAMQEQLASFNATSNFQDTLKMERASVNDNFDIDKIRRRLKPGELDAARPLVSIVGPAILYQNTISYNEAFETQIQNAIDDRRPLFHPEKLLDEKSLQAWKHPYDFMAGFMLSTLRPTVIRTARMQAEINEASVACALERYRNAHGEYPASLAALKPLFTGEIPADPITGAPFIYSRKPTGDYILYSVGWNKVDDHGKTEWKFHDAPDDEHGDWVWPSDASVISPK